MMRCTIHDKNWFFFLCNFSVETITIGVGFTKILQKNRESNESNDRSHTSILILRKLRTHAAVEKSEIYSQWKKNSSNQLVFSIFFSKYVGITNFLPRVRVNFRNTMWKLMWFCLAHFWQKFRESKVCVLKKSLKHWFNEIFFWGD